MNSGRPLIIDILGRSDFEWVTLETEHSALDYQECVNCLYAAQATNIVPFIRVAWNDPMLIKRALDIGAMGVVVPNIDTAADAARAVSASRYAPLGARGIGSSRGQLAYGEDYYDCANELVCVVLMIESADAVKNIDAIMQTPGVDICFIGPNDLAASLGVPLGLDNKHPDHVAACQKVIEAGKKWGVPVGIHCAGAQEAVRRIEEGYKWISIASDVRLLKLALNDVFDCIKKNGAAENAPKHSNTL
ncbi:MAG: aldolase/citrate lyase family protein, partial [Candidatus Omnitrophica bacterium]|nr:aldolase/citrate lyase family protein [Candidatus Omnitrophota bacterium]